MPVQLRGQPKAGFDPSVGLIMDFPLATGPLAAEEIAARGPKLKQRRAEDHGCPQSRCRQRRQQTLRKEGS